MTLTGPPEPVVRDACPECDGALDRDGEAFTCRDCGRDVGRGERASTLTVLAPTGEDGPVGDPLQTIELGTWVCQRCDVQQHIPPADGELHPPRECDACERQGPFVHAGGIDAQTALRADRLWHPPSGVDDGGYADLWDGVNAYLREHWDAGSDGGDDDEDAGTDGADAIYAGLTAYALSTWVREQLTFVPHLMLMGTTTGGKTRLLNTLARVSYRAHVTASATPASMFRLIDGYDVTYFASEYHGLPYDTQRQLDAVVRAGQKRGEHVDRAEQTATGQYEPETFDPFTHVAIATQYEPDDDIINRCIRVRSSPPDRDMPATLDEDRGRGLRDRLLYARFRLLDSDEWREAEQAAYDMLAAREITGRTREKLLSLVTVALVWGRTDEAFGAFMADVIDQDRTAAADSDDALVIEAIRDLASEQIGDQAFIGEGDPFAAAAVPLSDVAERYEAMTGSETSESWVGHVRARLGLDKARKRDGTVISDDDLGPKLRELCADHNLDWDTLDVHEPVTAVDPDDAYRGDCPECGHDRLLSHRHVEDGHRLCETCADEYGESVNP